MGFFCRNREFYLKGPKRVQKPIEFKLIGIIMFQRSLYDRQKKSRLKTGTIKVHMKSIKPKHLIKISLSKSGLNRLAQI